jgi:hypothetical protein
MVTPRRLISTPCARHFHGRRKIALADVMMVCGTMCLAGCASLLVTMTPATAERVRSIDRAAITPRSVGTLRSPVDVDNARAIDSDRETASARGATESLQPSAGGRALSDGKHKSLRHRNDCYETAKRAARWSNSLKEGPHCADQ